MKRLLILAPIIVTFAGCATGTHSHSSAETGSVASGGRAISQRPAPTHVVHGIRAEGQDIFGRRIFVFGKQRFTTLPEFKTFIESLPPGSIVAWDSGCIRYETIPLLDSGMTIQAFKDYCKEHAVEFRFICGY
jgi:hypothetical protein